MRDYAAEELGVNTYSPTSPYRDYAAEELGGQPEVTAPALRQELDRLIASYPQDIKNAKKRAAAEQMESAMAGPLSVLPERTVVPVTTTVGALAGGAATLPSGGGVPFGMTAGATAGYGVGQSELMRRRRAAGELTKSYLDEAGPGMVETAVMTPVAAGAMRLGGAAVRGVYRGVVPESARQVIAQKATQAMGAVGQTATEAIDRVARSRMLEPVRRYGRAFGRLKGPRATEFSGQIAGRVSQYEDAARQSFKQGMEKVPGQVDFEPVVNRLRMDLYGNPQFAEGLNVAISRQESRYGATLLKNLLENPGAARSLRPADAHEIVRTLESMPQVYGRVGQLEGKIGPAGMAGQYIEEAQRTLKRIPGVEQVYTPFKESMRKLDEIAPRSYRQFGERGGMANPYKAVTRITDPSGPYSRPEARQVAAEILGKDLAPEAEALRRASDTKRILKYGAARVPYVAGFALLERAIRDQNR